MSRFHSIYKLIVKYRYLVVFCIFVPWVMYFDKYSLVDLWEQRVRMKQLEVSKKKLQKNIFTNEMKYKELMGNDQEIEKMARETYFFKRDNEDVFVVKNIPNEDSK